MPAVSVVVPNYNHARFLRQRLESIFNQTYKDYEVILLDDCSTDNSREIIEQYRNHPKVAKIIFNTQNSGSTFKQWERGIHEAKGEFIWIAESDDYCENNFLGKLVEKLNEYQKAGVAYCQTVSVDSDNTYISNWIEHTDIFEPNIWYQNIYFNGPGTIRSCFLYSNIIPNASAAVFRKSVYKKTSGFETEMKLNGDWLFWIKMLEKSDLVFIAESLNYFRQHDNKATITNTSNYNNLKELVQLYKYFEKYIGLSLLQKSRMIKNVIRRLVFQLIHENIFISLKNLPKVTNALIQFDSAFYIYVFPAAFEFFKNRLSRNSRRKNSFSIKIDVSKIKIL